MWYINAKTKVVVMLTCVIMWWSVFFIMSHACCFLSVVHEPAGPLTCGICDVQKQEETSTKAICDAISLFVLFKAFLKRDPVFSKTHRCFRANEGEKARVQIFNDTCKLFERTVYREKE